MTGIIIARHVTRHVSRSYIGFPQLMAAYGYIQFLTGYAIMCGHIWYSYGEYGGIWLYMGFLTFKLVTVTRNERPEGAIIM